MFVSKKTGSYGFSYGYGYGYGSKLQKCQNIRDVAGFTVTLNPIFKFNHAVKGKGATVLCLQCN
jgi:hypothetical protein